MGKRRRNLFVLLFVLGLVVVSALVIANKPTKLGLDLKGGVELVYQGTPTGQAKEVSGERHRHARSKSSASGSTSSASPSPRSRASARPRSRSASPTSPTPSAATNRSATTAQLYFYDWEPNLIGREKAIGGHPGQRTARRRRSKKPNKEWKAAGRDADQSRQTSS